MQQATLSYVSPFEAIGRLGMGRSPSKGAMIMGTYVEESLATGEEVLHRGKLHWIIHSMSFGWFAAAVIILIAGVLVPESLQLYVWIAAGVLALIGLGFLITSMLRQISTDYAVTNKRIVAKHGFVSRDTSEQRLDKIESVEVVQSFLGRLLNYGTVEVNGTGTAETIFRRVAEPVSFRTYVNDAIERNNLSGAT